MTIEQRIDEELSLGLIHARTPRQVISYTPFIRYSKSIVEWKWLWNDHCYVDAKEDSRLIQCLINLNQIVEIKHPNVIAIDIIENASIVECLSSPSEYIRKCKEHLLSKK